MKKGDRLEILVDRPNGAELKKGDIVKFGCLRPNGKATYIKTECGWAVDHDHVKLLKPAKKKAAKKKVKK